MLIITILIRVGADVFGNITRIDNVIDGIAGKLETELKEEAEPAKNKDYALAR